MVLPTGWKRLPLQEICQSKPLVNPRKSPSKEFDYVDISSVSNATFSIGETKRLLGSEAPSRARKPIFAGDIIFSTTRPYLKSIAKVPENLDGQVCSTGFCVLRPSTRILSDWLFFSAISDELVGQVTPKMRGGNYPAVSDSDVLECEIPLPPIEEQRRLIARLKELMERVDEMAELRKEVIVEAAALPVSAIEEAMELSVGKKTLLGTICEIASTLVDPRESQYQELLHVGGANIVSGTGSLVDLKSASEENLVSGKFLFSPDDVLYSKIRPYLRKVARPDFHGLCSADMYPLRVKDPDQVHRGFLFFLLLSRRFTDYANQVSNRAGMPKVNREQLFAYEFELPSLEKQQDIVDLADRCFSSACTLSADLAVRQSEAASIKQAILRKAFAGEL